MCSQTRPRFILLSEGVGRQPPLKQGLRHLYPLRTECMVSPIQALTETLLQVRRRPSKLSHSTSCRMFGSVKALRPATRRADKRTVGIGKIWCHMLQCRLKRSPYWANLLWHELKYTGHARSYLYSAMTSRARKHFEKKIFQTEWLFNLPLQGW